MVAHDVDESDDEPDREDVRQERPGQRLPELFPRNPEQCQSQQQHGIQRQRDREQAEQEPEQAELELAAENPCRLYTASSLRNVRYSDSATGRIRRDASPSG